MTTSFKGYTLSDPFTEIEKEVNLEKFKSFFFRYKKIIIIILLIIIILPSIVFYLQYSQDKENIKISGYYVEIISLLQSDEKRALEELSKLKRYNHEGYNILSDIIVAKINLKNGNKDRSIDIINSLIEKKIKNPLFNKLITYYKAQILLELNVKEDLEKIISELLSFGGNWALLGHEIRGHYHFKNGNYNLAFKDFTKITNEQIVSSSLKIRAKEMLESIIIFNKSAN